MESDSPSKPPSISAQLRQRLSMGSRASVFSSDGGTAATSLHCPMDTSPTGLGSIKSAGVKSLGRKSVKSIGQSTAVSVGISGLRPATAEIPDPV